MGGHLDLEWQENAAELKQRYLQESQGARRTRLHALWLLREGHTITGVADLVGVHARTVQDWLAWYRHGGIAEVVQRIRGYHLQGVPPYLNTQQQRALVARVKLGDFKTVWEVVRWVEGRCGLRYSYKGMWELLRRLRLHLKVPRPQAAKGSQAAQEAWKKGA